ncbi:MAG: type I methionyl aminopeptidase [Candidatus Moranbacteria bacterium RIFOXYA12_FULL_44_15]|nr:MAG: type I methionyl aminopeptidase [Candidatus Moranbacteria bacterium RIFOXYA12_FULL_44_15]OGI34227.1 MAG: type I methionyl aminopeptidase [Candidatus Moranbacteria bacterium RIFOXYA2_FULL_43_15]
MIVIKNVQEIEAMREGGRILAGIMDEIGKNIAPGTNTHEIDQLARKLVFDSGGVPIFEGYGTPPFPSSVCASINSEVVHGIPRRDRIVQEGDIVKIDIGMKFKGMITDMARTFEAGKVSPAARKLVNATRESLDEGIRRIKAGAKLSEYSAAVDSYVRSHGFSAVRELVGHGVGRELHEDPQILNYKAKGKEVILKEGMTLALEPMINEGTHYIKLMGDGWTYATRDGKLSAHFEDTVVVKKGGCEILTRA